MRLQRRITTAARCRTRYSSRRLVVGAKSGKTYSAATLTAFGEDLNHHSSTPTSCSNSFFTGKPQVAGLGHAFLMRNYRAGLGKWQTADPMGYPDGWNQLAYCGNGATGSVDLWGCSEWKLVDEWNKETWSKEVELESLRTAPPWQELCESTFDYGDFGALIPHRERGENVQIGDPIYTKIEYETDTTLYYNYVWTYVYNRTDTYFVTFTTKQFEKDPSVKHALSELLLTSGSFISGPAGECFSLASANNSADGAIDELRKCMEQYGKTTTWTLNLGTVIFMSERQFSVGSRWVRE